MDQDLPVSRPDAWILLAVLLNDRPGGGSLRDLISAADYINHAIPTYEEISDSLTRLSATGLVEASDGRFRPAPPMASRFARVEARSVRGRLEALENLLLDGSLPPPASGCSTRPLFSPRNYEQALREYLKT